MSEARAFLDTNIVLYLLSSDAAKADIAERLLAEGPNISVQVLNEFVSVATRKLGLGWDVIHEVLDTVVAVAAVEPMTLETHRLAVEIAEQHRLNIYDAGILAAARIAGSEIVYSEDMHHGFRPPGGPEVRNPFAPT